MPERITLDYNLMLTTRLGEGRGIEPERLETALLRLEEAETRVSEWRAEGRLGFYDLVRQTGTIEMIEEFTEESRGRFEDIVVLGIGGSALGTRALRDAILDPSWNELPPEAREGRPRLHIHYRSPINFSDDLLNSAANSFERIEIAYQNLEHRKSLSLNLVDNDEEWLEKIAQHKESFEAAMKDDFNTAKAISVIFDLTRDANAYLAEKQTSEKVIEAFQDQIKTLLDVLGLTLKIEEQLLEEDIERLIEEREEARANKNYERADEIRDELKEQNIILEDTPQGVRWRRG